VEAFFWPKILWDFATKSLDKGVKPVPALQLLNLVMGLAILTWEWPLDFVAGSRLHRSVVARLVAMPLVALAAALLYQGGNASIYYIIAFSIYIYAYMEGEVSSASLSLRLYTYTKLLLQIINPEPWQTISKLATPAKAPVTTLREYRAARSGRQRSTGLLGPSP
jgi:hypothetical protein